MKHLLLILILCQLVACNQYPSDVEQTLILAGKNKTELIKVLNHYKGKDKLKYKAACFLIGNMPYHQCKYEIILDSSYYTYFIKVDSIYNQIFDKMGIVEINK